MKLQDVLNEAGLGDLKAQALKRITSALEHEEGRRGGEMLGRAITESVDQVMEGHSASFPVDQSIAAGNALCEQMAKELEAVAAVVRAYAPLQAGVVTAKTKGGDLAEARRARNAGTSAVKAALAGVVLEG